MKNFVKKLKSGFGGLIDAKASESYGFWTAVVLKMVGMFVPQVFTALDGVAAFISDGAMTGQMLLGGLIGYALMRVTSKAAKA